MTQAVGCDASQLLYALPTQREEILSVGQRLGVQTLLAISQVLDQTAARLRVSTQVRTLAEMSLVRICHLQNLDEISALIEQLKGGEALPVRPVPGGAPAGISAKKNEIANPAMLKAATPAAVATPQPPTPPVTLQPPASPGGSGPSDVARSSEPSAAEDYPRAKPGAGMQVDVGKLAAGAASPKAVDGGGLVRVEAGDAERVWQEALAQLESTSGVVAAAAHEATQIRADGQGRLVVSFPESMKFMRESCARPQNLSRIEAALQQACGGRVLLTLATHPDPAGATTRVDAPARPNPKQQQASAAADPFVKRAVELFDGDSDRLRYVAPRDGSQN
jgi:DNA polymerase III gamma/tau subunit